jgi:hypothetical protein
MSPLKLKFSPGFTIELDSLIATNKRLGLANPIARSWLRCLVSNRAYAEARAGSGSSGASAGEETASLSMIWGATPVSGISHSQQSLQRRQRRHRWLMQASFVQKTQISRDLSPQIEQLKTK